MARSQSRLQNRESLSILRWRTDARLEIVSVHSGGVMGSIPLPSPGMMIPGDRRRRNSVFDPSAHRRALQGTSSYFEVRIGSQVFEVVVSPRYDRHRTIIGTRGVARPLKAPREEKGTAPYPAAAAALDPALPRSFASAVRSLELARTLASTAKIAAETRTRKALELQGLTEQALLRKETEERRSRLLADASAILDSGDEFGGALDRLGRLLLQRTADWWALQLREDGLLRRSALQSRDESLLAVLDRCFPLEAPAESLDVLHLSRHVLCGSAGQPELADLISHSQLSPELLNVRISSYLRVPVRLHGRLVGALSLGAYEPETRFDQEDARMAEDLGYRIALAKESLRLYQEAQREIELRKQAEARLLKFNAELERRVSERTLLLEETTREANSFAYTVAHDLRAPLRAITGFSQVLLEDYSGVLDAAGKEYLDRIIGSAQRMDDLIRDLLEYARLNRAEITLEVVDLDVLLARTMQILAQERSERNAEVRWTTPLGKVIAQEVILGQALRNLLSNAMKFVPRDRRPEVAVTSEHRGDRLRIVIQDNGIGIAPEHQARVFGMFERLNTAEEYPGTGMGLAIVRRAVERLGGDIGLDSTVGKGSQFWIELPVADGALSPGAPI
jgi:signal transduction histidine kinase